ncbi:934_t:CDS:2 [Ambispora leptoticha]|uniref:934_t:CDS:1 n=1 Tax=Ambispora leptoticha TaxID=144679 RepID=A0A9N8Z459_9GLOM|nr:934_t:CDS:2 [Ambispora leptoticha]
MEIELEKMTIEVKDVSHMIKTDWNCYVINVSQIIKLEEKYSLIEISEQTSSDF